MSLSPALTDSIGRRIDYLRVSLTERCDLRCAYCHPRSSPAPAPQDVLTAADVAAIVAAAARLGVRRVRLTGGEPLLRSDLEEIVRRVRAVPGVEDLGLTTNGQMLAGRAAGLAAAGLMRVNVSLDSLDPDVYAALTGGGDAGNVLRGIEAALVAGLSPVKLNVVLTSPSSLERVELAGFVQLARERPVHVRFIEAMPTCGHLSHLPAQQVLERLAQMGELHPAPGPEGGGPARYYQLDDSRGTLGVITPISEPFCERCNRLRVSARGDLIPCLFSSSGLSLLPALRGGDVQGAIGALLRKATAAKPCRYAEVADPAGIRAMYVIGG